MRLLLLALLAGLLAGCATPPAPADWTLMFYVAADNDLEDAEITDLLDLLAARAGPRIHLTALVDRSPQGPDQEGYSAWMVPGQGDWSGARWLLLEGGQAHLLADWGEQNTADSRVLERFLQQAVERFPARLYGLFVADHGEAWRGICSDDGATDPDALMPPEELARALGGAGFDASHPLELLAFDACLMGSLEVASRLAPHVRYLVASEEMVPGSGFAYRQPIERLTARPQTGGRELGEWLVEAYAQGFALAADPEERREGEVATMALLDLRRLAPVEQTLNDLGRELARRLRGDPRFWLELARVRSRTLEYGRSEQPDEPGSYLSDLGHLAELLTPLPGLERLARDLRQRLRALVVTSYAGPSQPHASGLAIFFPPGDSELEAGYPAGPWRQMLTAYVEHEPKEGSVPDLGELESESPGTPGPLRVGLGSPAALDEAWLVVAQDGWMLGSQPTYPEDGSVFLEDVFDGRWPSLSGAGPGLMCPVADLEALDEAEEVYLASIPVQWRRAQGPWHEATLGMQLNFARDDWEGGLVSLTRRSGILGRSVQLRSGDQLRMPQERLRDGQRRYGPSLTVGDPGELRLGLQPVASGSYQVGFLITTYGGRRAFKTLPVRVE